MTIVPSAKCTNDDEALAKKLANAQVDSKVWLFGEKRPYTVMARSERYMVCTKPFAARHTVLYTVIDLKEEVRGTENLIFCAGAETQALCWEMIGRLGTKTRVSSRNRVPLRVNKVYDEKDHIEDTLKEIRQRKGITA